MTCHVAPFAALPDSWKPEPSLGLCCISTGLGVSRSIPKLWTTHSHSWFPNCFSLVFIRYITVYWSVPHVLNKQLGRNRRYVYIPAAGKSGVQPCHLAQPLILPRIFYSQVSPFLDTLPPVAFKCLVLYILFSVKKIQTLVTTKYVQRYTPKYFLSFGLYCIFSFDALSFQEYPIL